jgi:hypothetical protein
MSSLVTQIGKEVWVTSYPHFPLGVTQIGNETWLGTGPYGDIQETANATDTATASYPPLQVTQIGNENWVSAHGNVRVTQVGKEAWTQDPSKLLVTQIGLENWLNDPSRLFTTQIGKEVWISDSVVGITEKANAVDIESAIVVSPNLKALIFEPCNASDSCTAFNIPPPPPGTGQWIINGWYTDSKGGIYYYYRDKDMNNAPRPPITI